MVFARACRLAVAARFSTPGVQKAAPVFARSCKTEPSGEQLFVRVREGFPPNRRLRTPAQFGRVFASPTRSADRYFTILACQGRDTAARLGVTVGKRVAQRAVDRNRIKRLIRESFRQRLDLPDWDFVVIAKPIAKQADNQVLRASLDRRFDRLAAEHKG